MNPKEKSLTLFALIVIVLSVVLYSLSWIPLRPFLFAVFASIGLLGLLIYNHSK